MDYLKNFYNSMGCYPPEYNKAVHGPYDPGRYYGKPDKNFMELKLSEVPSWFARRRFDPYSMICAMARFRNRWDMKYNFPYRSKATYALQAAFLFTVLFHIGAYKTTRKHKNYKYHW